MTPLLHLLSNTSLGLPLIFQPLSSLSCIPFPPLITHQLLLLRISHHHLILQSQKHVILIALSPQLHIRYQIFFLIILSHQLSQSLILILLLILQPLLPLIHVRDQDCSAIASNATVSDAEGHGVDNVVCAREKAVGNFSRADHVTVPEIAAKVEDHICTWRDVVIKGIKKKKALQSSLGLV